ncbi:hypothetical protein Ocin01_08305 [Orchesella cincta]|uniref:Uncharacterized protein n=1 Tax=Orchesella cincta TaxID=48709 RepID=A0A1D2MZC6_ORCCI|nr:hypothetical protein Ocin01_08305 [Orchesella cincta]
MEVVLGIPSVLKNILRFMGTPFIAHTCRLVNSDWNHESCRILQERIPINFTTCDQLVHYCNTFETTIEGTSIGFNSFRFSSDLMVSAIQDRAFGALRRLHIALERFVKICGERVANLEVTLYSIYPLEDDAMRTSTVLMHEQLIKMIYSSFPNVAHLKVLFLMSYAKEVSEDFDIHTFMKPWASIKLPNIERLTVEVAVREDGNIDSHTGSEQIITTFMKVILSSAVNLKSFSSSNLPIGKEKIIQDCILYNFVQISPSLRDLNLVFRINTDEEMGTLCSKHFSNLQNLRLEIGSKNVTPDALRDFFAHYSKSVRFLSIRFMDATHSSFVYPTLPLGICLGHLSSLDLEQYNGSLNYQLLPKLENLTVEHSRIKGILSSILLHQHNVNVLTNEGELSNVSFRQLTIGPGCKIQNDNGKSTPSTEEFIARVVPCFSHLSSLKVLNFTLPLPLVFKHCTSLKALSVLKCGGVTDLVISGISQRLLEAMSSLDFGQLTVLFTEKDEKVLSRKPELNEFLDSLKNRNGFREAAFIGCLSGLQFLEIEGEISDKGVLYGIIHCKRLKTLKLHTNLISWRGQRVIQSTLKDILRFEVVARRNN